MTGVDDASGKSGSTPIKASRLSSLLQIRFVDRSTAKRTGNSVGPDLHVLRPFLPRAPVEVGVPSRNNGPYTIASGREDKEDRQYTLYFGTIKVHVSDRTYERISRLVAWSANARGIQDPRRRAFQTHEARQVHRGEYACDYARKGRHERHKCANHLDRGEAESGPHIWIFFFEADQKTNSKNS